MSFTFSPRLHGSVVWLNASRLSGVAQCFTAQLCGSMLHGSVALEEDSVGIGLLSSLSAIHRLSSNGSDSLS